MRLDRKRGVHHPRARLTPDDVHLIRALSTERVSRRAIARKFDVSKRAVEAILTGETWKHV
jgi:hypothetical protein